MTQLDTRAAPEDYGPVWQSSGPPAHYYDPVSPSPAWGSDWAQPELPRYRRADLVETSRSARSAYAYSAAPSLVATPPHPSLDSSPRGMRHHSSASPLMGQPQPPPPVPFMMTRASTAPSAKRPSVRLYENGARSGSGSRKTASHRDLSPRSAHHYRSTPESRRSIRSSFDSDSDRDTDATDSSDDDDEEDTDADGVYVDKDALRDRLDIRRRPNVYPLQPQPPDDALPQRRAHRRRGSGGRDTGRSSSRSRSRKHAQIIYEEDAEEPTDPDITMPAAIEDAAASERRSRNRTQSRHRSVSARRSVSRHTAATQGPRLTPKRSKSLRRADSPEEEWGPRASSKGPSRRYCETEVPAAFAHAPVSLRKSHTHLAAAAAAAAQMDSSPADDSSVMGSIVGYAPPADMSFRQHGCVVCMDDFSAQHLVTLRCGHQVCTTCLMRKFKTAVADPQAMPPRCCTAEQIPIETVEKLFDPGFKRVWNRKFFEYASQRRLYCPRCGEWLKPEDMYSDGDRKAARCSKCRTKVCRLCSGKWHMSRECPPKEGPGWGREEPRAVDGQRCYQCRAKMMLRDGEDRMACIHCGAESCMICGTKWKMCDCPVFECEAPDSSRSEFAQNPFSMRGDRFGTMTVPVRAPSVRDLRPSSRGGALAAPVDATAMMSTRPEDAEFNMRRRMHEQRDEDLSRRMHMALPASFPDDEAANMYDTGYGEASDSDEPDEYTFAGRGRRGFLEAGPGTGMRSRAASAILPSVPQPPPQPPTPPQQQQQQHQSMHQRQLQHPQHPQHPHMHLHQQHTAGPFAPTPPPPPPPQAPFESSRTAPPGDYYMSGVNRARAYGGGAPVAPVAPAGPVGGGMREVRSTSRDRRLVDRFSAERTGGSHRSKAMAPPMSMPGGLGGGNGSASVGMMPPMGMTTAPPMTSSMAPPPRAPMAASMAASMAPPRSMAASMAPPPPPMVSATAPPMTSLGALAPPPPPPQQPLPSVPGGMPAMRRHAMDAEIFDNPDLRAARSSHRLWYGGVEELDATEPYGFGGGVRRRSASMREELLQRRSTMAGLTGPERGMGRVHEWLTYVKPGSPVPTSAESEF